LAARFIAHRVAIAAAGAATSVAAASVLATIRPPQRLASGNE
jgi:hypothetical protein